MRSEIAALTSAIEEALFMRTSKEAGALINALWQTVAQQPPYEAVELRGEEPVRIQPSS